MLQRLQPGPAVCQGGQRCNGAGFAFVAPFLAGAVDLAAVDDATLKDTTSIAQYGQKEMVLDLGTCGETLAINYGRRYLNKYKQPTYSVSSPLRVRQVYAAPGKGRVIPASQIQAGKRLLITDYLTDLSGTGLTVLITRTEYDHDSRMCTLSFGVPDNLAVLLAQKG